MSLRVLLADESDTIKKVFQLALQDFNAEVKGVHSGLDVIDVALSFKPDIIFADVLLQKRNGYDICLELKQHPMLSKIPVVLMWSSFMELDQAQFKRSLANDQLEKPFDADFLRDLVKKYAPVVAENPMAQFLNFPKSISAGLKEDIKAKKMTLEENSHLEHSSEFNKTSATAVKNTANPQVAIPLPASFEPPPPSKSLFDDLKLQSAAIDKAAEQAAAKTPPPLENWQTTDLSKFKLENEKNDNLDKFESLNLNPPPAKSSTGKEMDGFSQVSTSALDEFIIEEHTAETNLDDLGFGPVVVHAGDKARAEDTSEPAEDADDEAGAYGTPAFSLTPSPTKVPPPRAPVSTKTKGLNDGEIEAIVRAHTEEFIKTEIKQSLFEMMEKIVREELNKVLEEEVSLKQELSSDQQ
jgi:CheY-like chemotaxis protein